jgi:hypothetical protein
MAKQIVSFQAVKTEKKPVIVKFRTKTGETISFQAVKTEKKPVIVKFSAKKRK